MPINFGQLVPLTQFSPIQTAQPQAQQAPDPGAGGGSGGGGGGGGLGGLLGGLGKGLGGMGGAMGGIGKALGGMGGGNPIGGMLKGMFGSNPVSTMNQALSTQMSSMTNPQMVQSLLSNPTVQQMPGMIQNTLNQARGGQPGQLPAAMSPQNIQNVGRQAFAGQQVPQQSQQNPMQGTQSNNAQQMLMNPYRGAQSNATGMSTTPFLGMQSTQTGQMNQSAPFQNSQAAGSGGIRTPVINAQATGAGQMTAPVNTAKNIPPAYTNILQNPNSGAQTSSQPRMMSNSTNTAFNNTSDQQLNQTMNAIGKIETGDSKNPYSEITHAGHGRAAYGKYQIMGENIPSWTKAATGKSYTPEEFLNNPQLQDQTAKFQMQQYFKAGHSPNDVASMWFTGRPLNKVSGDVKDALGTSNNDYQRQFNKYYQQQTGQQAPQTVQQAHEQPTPNLPGNTSVPPELAKTPAYAQSMKAYTQARANGLTKSPYVVNVDFSQPATAKRLSVINAETGKVVFQSEVAQGAPGFSNTPNSHQSSLGTFQTEQTYNGHNGYSLRIKGLDKGVNDNVEARDVVVHGADYIGNGKTGHSFGCFAVPNSVAPQLINLIKGGTIINAYGGPGGGNMSGEGATQLAQTPSQSSPIQQQSAQSRQLTNAFNPQQNQQKQSPQQQGGQTSSSMMASGGGQGGQASTGRSVSSNFYYMPYFQGK